MRNAGRPSPGSAPGPRPLAFWSRCAPVPVFGALRGAPGPSSFRPTLPRCAGQRPQGGRGLSPARLSALWGLHPEVAPTRWASDVFTQVRFSLLSFHATSMASSRIPATGRPVIVRDIHFFLGVPLESSRTWLKTRSQGRQRPGSVPEGGRGSLPWGSASEKGSHALFVFLWVLFYRLEYFPTRAMPNLGLQAFLKWGLGRGSCHLCVDGGRRGASIFSWEDGFGSCRDPSTGSGPGGRWSGCQPSAVRPLRQPGGLVCSFGRPTCSPGCCWGQARGSLLPARQAKRKRCPKATGACGSGRLRGPARF